MLAFLGDIHGEDRALRYAHDQALANGATALIQVGDFGWFANTKAKFARWRWELPIYWIDGNHESFKLLEKDAPMPDTINEVLPNVWYVPRGLTLELDGRRLLFLGGGGSVDRHLRIQNGWHWESAEAITDADVDRALTQPTPDLVVVHCPPQSAIRTHFDVDPMEKVRRFGVPVDWSDPSADQVERVWEHHGRPPLVCGHMHRRVREPGVLRMLDCHEVWLLPTAGSVASHL